MAVNLNPATILVVDDNRANREILHDLILALGHIPTLAEHGAMALERIREKMPDLVLLDILMPEMDGYEVLLYIKEHFSLCHLPVIMISAIDEIESVARCIKMGADDYLIKPFNVTLLKARIVACLERKRLLDREDMYRRQIEDYNMNLEERIYEKTRELAEAHEKLKILNHAKSDFLKLISHELRTPLTGMVGIAEALFSADLSDAKRQKFQEVFKFSLDKLIDIVKQAVLLTQIEVSGEMFTPQANNIHSILESAVTAAMNFAQFRQVTFAVLPACDALVISDKELLTNAITALLKTAVRFSSSGNQVKMTCDLNLQEIEVGIHAEGQTIPEELITRFFDVFSIADSIMPGGDLGLGPPVAERIVSLFKGSVTVKNQEKGMSFVIKLRLAPPANLTHHKG